MSTTAIFVGGPLHEDTRQIEFAYPFYRVAEMSALESVIVPDDGSPIPAEIGAYARAAHVKGFTRPVFVYVWHERG